MTAARTIALTPEELRDLLEQAVETGVQRALERVGGRAVKPANEKPRRDRRRKRVASADAHEEIARMNVRKGIGRG